MGSPEFNATLNKKSNGTLANAAFKYRMHPTVERLFQAAQAFMREAGDPRPVTPSELARVLGLNSQNNLNNWASRGMSKAAILDAAKTLQVDPFWLETGEGQMLRAEDFPKFSRLMAPAENTEPGPEVRGLVPLISWVTAGAFDSANDPLPPGEAEDWLPMPKKNGKHTYALRVRGDSMTAPHGKSYPDGCIIFVDPEKRSPSTGDRIIAKLEGTDEVTFKQFVSDAGRIWLRALNPTYPPIVEEFKVLGTIIGKWEDE